jgi:hypothetical protein
MRHVQFLAAPVPLTTAHLSNSPSAMDSSCRWCSATSWSSRVRDTSTSTQLTAACASARRYAGIVLARPPEMSPPWAHMSGAGCEQNFGRRALPLGSRCPSLRTNLRALCC